MNRLDLLAGLFRAREVLAKKIIYMMPSTDDEALVLRKLLQKRDQLSMAIAVVVQTEMKLSVRTLEEDSKKIDDLTAKLTALGETIEDVKTAIGIVTEIIAVAAAVASASA